MRIAVNMRLIWKVSTYMQEKFDISEFERYFNCTVKYVTLEKSFIDFYNDADATAFLLRWGK